MNEEKSNIMDKKIIIIAIAAVLVGVGAGYLIFGGAEAEQQEHVHAEPVEEAAGSETIWTCSMHPQIRQEEPGLCPICEMDLIPLDDMQSDNPLVLEMTQSAVKLANLQTTVVGQRGKAEATLRLTGKIKADERRVASQVAHVPGRIEELFVTFTGEPVQKGQQLARIYSPELITAQRELLEALKIQDTNPQLAEAARKKLRYWRIPEETIQEIIDSGAVQETVTIYAETGGIVQERYVSVGDYVKEGEVLFELVDLSRLWVLFDAYEDDLSVVKVGDRVEFTTPALPDQTFSSRVTFIDPMIDPETRTAQLRAEVYNRGGQLKPEMFVRGTVLSTARAKEGLLAPKTAVLWTGKRSVVYVEMPNTTVPSYEYREVVLGESVGDAYIVESGLAPGEAVVTNGAFAIDAAAQLNNQQSMMNRRVNIKGMERPDAPDYQAGTPQEFKVQLQELLQQYINLKNALVESDPEAAAEAAARFVEYLDEVDMTLLEGQPHMYWMDQMRAMQQHAKSIAESQDVEEQRKQFGFLSDLLIKTVEAFGTARAELYVQHCPMAFDDAGADWLSYEDEVLNPYFGDRMLKCGTVERNLGESDSGQ